MKRALLLLALAACGGSVQQQPDAAPPDIDAAVDAATGTTQLELAGGARMTGGTLVVDVKLTPIKP